MRIFGILLIFLAMGLPFIWFSDIAAGRDRVALFSQFMGIQALICMSIAQIIATRASFVEWIFGGLDRSYILHKWLGISSLTFLLIHDTVDAEMSGLGRQGLVEEFAETLGELSLYGLIILVVITIATFIPYHLWKWTHRIMGGFFAAGALHYLLILKPFKNGDPLGVYVSAVCLLGLLAFSWRLLPANLRPSRTYKVASIEKTGNATSVSLTPNGRPLRHRAGQFAFVSFAGQEPHPFTISSAPREDGRIRMSVAELGDYTQGLDRKITVGMNARIEGPFGHFERYKPTRPQLWIAAGIGITPFLAWAQECADSDAPVNLVFCVKSKAEAAHLDELEVLTKVKADLNLTVHVSSEQGRATAETILRQTGLEPSGLVVSFCGPRGMRESLKAEFAAMGVRGRNFRFEEFEIRTGIGLRRLADFLMNRSKNRLAPRSNQPAEN